MDTFNEFLKKNIIKLQRKLLWEFISTVFFPFGFAYKDPLPPLFPDTLSNPPGLSVC